MPTSINDILMRLGIRPRSTASATDRQVYEAARQGLGKTPARELTTIQPPDPLQWDRDLALDPQARAYRQQLQRPRDVNEFDEFHWASQPIGDNYIWDPHGQRYVHKSVADIHMRAPNTGKRK